MVDHGASSLWLALVALLVADGFVQDQMGQLTWDGSHDGLLLLALLVGCAVSADVRSGLIEAAADAADAGRPGRREAADGSSGGRTGHQGGIKTAARPS